MSDDPFAGLPRNHFGAIYADPPWHFKAWAEYKPLANGNTRAVQRYYETLSADQIRDLPVAALAAEDCALFLWVVWPSLAEA